MFLISDISDLAVSFFLFYVATLLRFADSFRWEGKIQWMKLESEYNNIIIMKHYVTIIANSIRTNNIVIS